MVFFNRILKHNECSMHTAFYNKQLSIHLYLYTHCWSAKCQFQLLRSLLFSWYETNGPFGVKLESVDEFFWQSIHNHNHAIEGCVPYTQFTIQKRIVKRIEPCLVIIATVYKSEFLTFSSLFWFIYQRIQKRKNFSEIRLSSERWYSSRCLLYLAAIHRRKFKFIFSGTN